MAYDFAVDFSPIGKLGEIYRQAQQREHIAQLYPQSGGDLNLARLALAAQQDARDFAFREAEAKRVQANADRSFGLQEKQVTAGLEGNKVPAGFRPTPAGGLQAVPGGPADPAYIEATTAAKDKGKQFNAGEITKLVDEGGKFANLANFSNTFQDRFAGYRLPLAGSAAMTAGRYLPEGLTGKDVAEGSSWWQGYDRYKNVVRNELFGSALTANEQAAFERADISPGMEPARIRENLGEQQRILKDAMKRKAGALVAGGYQAEPIARAYGLKLEDLGVETTKKGTKPAGTPPVEGARQGRKPDGTPGWFIQKDGKTYLVE